MLLCDLNQITASQLRTKMAGGHRQLPHSSDKYYVSNSSKHPLSY